LTNKIYDWDMQSTHNDIVCVSQHEAPSAAADSQGAALGGGENKAASSAERERKAIKA
jgi:hypothetical protein